MASENLNDIRSSRIWDSCFLANSNDYVLFWLLSSIEMTTHLVTFSDESMSRAADLCIGSGQRYGCNTVTRFEYGPFTGSRVFEENEGVFLQSRGLGYWAWKPVIIDWTLNNYREEYIVYPHNVKDGDILIYSDAGVEFIAPVSHIIDRMDQDIFLFGNNWEHAHWCKRDVIETVWPTPQCPGENCGDIHHNTVWRVRYGKQAQASVIFFRVSDYTRKFVAEWLDWCLFEGGRLIDDSPSRLPNHPEFREHRHDQAILTTLAYREGIKLHAWPAVYNDGAFTYEKLPEYAGDDYPILFHHHRRRDHEWPDAALRRYHERTLRGFVEDNA